jgi:hypothetical protein
MKDDHTYNGIPVPQIPTSKLVELIKDGGVEINNMDGYSGSIRQAEEDVVKRLQIELTIRLYNLRS